MEGWHGKEGMSSSCLNGFQPQGQRDAVVLCGLLFLYHYIGQHSQTLGKHNQKKSPQLKPNTAI